MVSWGYAFKRGLIIWLWTILWGIIGGVIAIAISGTALLTYIMNPSSTFPTGAMLGVVAGIIIGALISSIGGYATMVKVILESAEEPRKPPPP